MATFTEDEQLPYIDGNNYIVNIDTLNENASSSIKTETRSDFDLVYRAYTE